MTPRTNEIEDLARSRLDELQRILGKPLTPPIPIVHVAEDILGLDFLWEPIEELPGETVLGGLKAKERLIVLNEKHRDLFAEKPGLERSTIGHELGHWDLFIDKTTLDQPTLFDVGENAPFVFRNSPTGEVSIIRLLMTDPDGQELLRKIQSRTDDSGEASAVNRYAAALSMPADLLREQAMKIDRTQWKNIYRLRDLFGVTISAMVVRLQQMNLLYVGENKKLYESREAGTGQLGLGF